MTDSITQKVHEYFISNLRAFPCTLSIYSFVGGLVFNNPAYIVFGIYITLCDMLISHPLKLLSKTIYKALNTDTIPILGRGPRPEGAKYCGCFITESNFACKNNVATANTANASYSCIRPYQPKLLRRQICRGQYRNRHQTL